MSVRLRVRSFVLLAIAAVGVVLWLFLRLYDQSVLSAPIWVAGLPKAELESASCISCHQDVGAQWTGSQHQLANRMLNPSRPTDPKDFSNLGAKPTMAIGVSPLVQFLVETQAGKFQAHEQAWDPVKQEWFNVFGIEARQPGEWGHWTGQSMNWNSSCARCHMTAFDKSYDESTKSYKSKWVEQGVGCVQCHGPMTDHESKTGSQTKTQIMETCATCHARAEDLTASAPPGATFEDHLRLQLVSGPQYYHADGQVVSENFEWGSFKHSKMFAAGVTCLDCHNPHSGKTKLPLEDNSLCLQCHASGNQKNAPTIDPLAHSFHQEGSIGNRCVSCHMVEKTYMQRDKRRDHGFIIPDPLLNKELGIPDACSGCHVDLTLERLIQIWDKRYKSSGKAAPRRARTRAVAQAFNGDVSALADLLELLNQEKVPGWRASLLGLADQLSPGSESVAEAAKTLLSDADPMLRASAVRALAAHPPSHNLVQKALKDPVRLVRLDAELALSRELEVNSNLRRELDDYLNASIENPIALYRRGQDRFDRGLREQGMADLQQAIELDPLSAPLPEALGYMLNSLGRSAEAAKQFEKAAQLLPQDPRAPYLAALAWVEAGDTAQAEKMFWESIRRDSSQARVLYNLGLLLSQAGRVNEALRVLASAESGDPNDADIPYATAAISATIGKRHEAAIALRRVLVINPSHQAARDLMLRLGLEPKPIK